MELYKALKIYDDGIKDIWDTVASKPTFAFIGNALALEQNLKTLLVDDIYTKLGCKRDEANSLVNCPNGLEALRRFGGKTKATMNRTYDHINISDFDTDEKCFYIIEKHVKNVKIGVVARKYNETTGEWQFYSSNRYGLSLKTLTGILDFITDLNAENIK